MSLPRRVSYLIFKSKCCAPAASCLSCYLLKQMLCPCYVVSLIYFLKVNAVTLPRHVSHVSFLNKMLFPCHVVSVSYRIIQRKCCAPAASCLSCYLLKQMLCPCYVVSLIYFLNVNAVSLPHHVSYVIC